MNTPKSSAKTGATAVTNAGGRERDRRSTSRSARRRRRYGFTLVELLVVITIVLIVSALALPTILPALANRQVSEAARIFQAALVGARDAAIRANAMRGIRLLPDPVLTVPAAGVGATGGTTTLAYNRIQQLETAPDYTEGKVNIGPMLPSTTPGAGGSTATFPPVYPVGSGNVYPFPNPNTGIPQVLMVEESIYTYGFEVGPNALLNAPTSWYWNIRVGDQIRFGSTGRYYTVVGPLINGPWTTGDNLELFVNVGAPGTTPPLTRTYYNTAPPNQASPVVVTTGNPEFLFLVNGADGNGDGYPDNGWDGFDNDYVNGVDDILEWIDNEQWYGSQQSVSAFDFVGTMGSTTNSPSPAYIVQWGKNGGSAKTLQDSPYVIKRRPVPVEGAREVMLPSGVVIDATTLVTLNGTFPTINFASERSRIPVDPFSLNVDVMLLPNGQYVPTTIYSSPTAFNDPVYLFWLTKREDVLPPVNNQPTVPYLLPMPKGTPHYPNMNDTSPRYLTADRWMVNLFTKSGNITSDVIQNFDGNIPSQPFYDAMQGMTEAK